MKFTALVLAALLPAAIHSVPAQISVSSSTRVTIPASHFIVPQTRSFALPATATVQVTEVIAAVDITDQFATTVLDIVLTNAGGSRLESQMIVPVPDGAVLRGFTFQGGAAQPTAQLLERDEARRIYDQIVAQVRDPALLEFLGCNLIRSSVFPVEPRSGQRVRITYETLLPRDGDRIDYVLPRSESIEYRVPWQITVNLHSKSPISTVYSPSHPLDTVRQNESGLRARLATGSTTEPGPFRLSFLAGRSEMTASLLAYPDPKSGGGYFLLLAGAPSRPQSAPPLKREVILVLDRSGSMAGEKLEQVRAAALQVIEGLDDGEAFNIIVYNETVEVFSPDPVLKNDETMRAARTYIRNLRVRGGTNIHDAMQEALRMKSTRGFLPLVLFLTDGLPTVGQTSEKAIRELASKANPHNRRVFTFGVGVDVNTPLLDRVAAETRATSTFVLPREDVEVKVAQVFNRLSGPVLSEPQLRAFTPSGRPAPGRVRDILPDRLPDIFEGDQLVLLGQYIGSDPVRLEIRGDYAGRERVFQFEFDPAKATTRNAFVPRLWASRRIGVLTAAIRDLGADIGLTTSQAPNDPRMRELVDEIVRLSKEFGILSEYTAFLAREGTDLTQHAELFAQCYDNFDTRALKVRSGIGAYNQSLNGKFQAEQQVGNSLNRFYDANLNAVEINTVQQVNDRAFYKRGNRWVDSSIADHTNTAAPRVVEVGSAEFRRLTERLASENRQGAIALKGEILLRVGSETVLVR